jgi:hypothetical protein
MPPQRSIVDKLSLQRENPGGRNALGAPLAPTPLCRVSDLVAARAFTPPTTRRAFGGSRYGGFDGSVGGIDSRQ